MINVCEEKKISFDFSSPFKIFLSIILRCTCDINITVTPSGGTKKLIVFILHDLCCEVFS